MNKQSKDEYIRNLLKSALITAFEARQIQEYGYIKNKSQQEYISDASPAQSTIRHSYQEDTDLFNPNKLYQLIPIVMPFMN